ncbi:MAG: tRNA lysidine(34) synthetase TilS, partial [Gammaproteobacteria bacterium]
MKFSPDALYIQLLSVPLPAAWQVAFSGGLDSSVLLHAMATLRERFAITLGAVHVHHGLQADADAWANHCRRVCAGYDIPLSVLHADARPVQGESPEAAARHARYTALADWLAPDHCLLTAQHQDDQAETLLLQLLRGAGVHGLASMPVCTAFGEGTHFRPLLLLRRAALHDYALAAGLEWIEDPSNAETGIDRNFLRHAVMPLLQSRWPALSGNLSRSAAHAAEAAGLLDVLAADDRQAVAGPQADTLS